MMGNFGRSVVAWIGILLLIFVVYDNIVGVGSSSSRKISFSEFVTMVESGKVKEVAVRGDNLSGMDHEDRYFHTLQPPYYTDIYNIMKSHDVNVEVLPLRSGFDIFLSILISWFPILLLVGVSIFFMRQMNGGGGKAMGFGKSKARMISGKENKVKFGDVAGIDEAKVELEEIVEYLREPGKFQKLGGKIPRGCLLVGGPGTGKTLLAKAIAGEANVPFFSISGSDFVEMFVGVGASRVRDMFDQAKKHSPCIIFIDEIDAVGRKRGSGYGGGNDEREQTLNQMLVEMDGFNTNQGVIVLAATNRPDVLDQALLRPGRFDRQVVVPSPDIRGREKILNIHMAKIKFMQSIDINRIARSTAGFSGADLANLVNESALLAARKNRSVVTTDDLEHARDKIMLGVERKTVIKDEEKELTAYHEGGHALAVIHCQNADPIYKATILPRGRALGFVSHPAQEDRVSETRGRLKDHITIAMAGRVAEELIFGYTKVTTGASSDIQTATSVAHKMVTKCGMSDKIGPILIEDHDPYQGGKHISESLAKEINQEVKKLVDEGYKAATKILKDNMDQLHAVAKALLEYETLTGSEIADVIAGKKIKTEDKNKVESSSVPSTRKKTVRKKSEQDQ